MSNRIPRILLLITDLRIGGTPTVVRELAIRLNGSGGAEIEVACLGTWGPVVDQIQSAGIRVTRFNARSARDFPRVVRRLVQLVRDNQIDTVFSFLVHANAVAAAASRIRTGIRWIQSIQTTQPTPAWHWKIQSFAQHMAERIVVPSPSVARVAVDWANVPPEKIVIIPNAVDLDQFALPRDRTEDTGGPPVPRVGTIAFEFLAPSPGTPGEGWGEGLLRNHVKNPNPNPLPEYREREPEPLLDRSNCRVPRVGFIGRLDPVKRVSDLVEAMTLIDPVAHLHIYGEGADRQNIEAAIRRFNVKQRVSLHGAAARPQEALAKMDLLVLPSQAEGFGLVLIEAMAAGVPVVATDVPGIRDVVRHGETGLLVPAAAPQVLAAAINRILTDQGLQNGLVSRARDDVRRRFSWEVVLPQYQRLLLQSNR